MTAEHSPLTINAALARAIVQLQPAAGAALDAQLLLGNVLGRSRAWLLAHSEAWLPPGRHAEFQRAVERRANGEPVAYITGRREFWSLELLVSPAVLVPRPETELVVERALALCGVAAATAADLGTGSGAIALALAQERAHWKIIATDRATAALAIADANARALNIRNVTFLAGDWFGPLAGLKFDLIASNPPYIAAGDPALENSALRHEPGSALSSGVSGLEDLMAIVAGAVAHLRADGWLVLEHGATQAQAVADLLVVQGFRHVRCHTDLAGLPRVTEAQRPAAGITTTEESAP